MMGTSIEIEICQECTLVIANGMDSIELTDERIAAITDGLTSIGNDGMYVVITDDEIDFSTRECDVCRDHYAGYRRSAEILSR